MKNKNCRVCGIEFTPTGPASLYCEVCAVIKRKEAKTREIRKRAKMPGVGKGGYPHRAEQHPNFKHGRWTYETIRYEIKQSVGNCGGCGKDLTSATHYQWVIHHKDHNPYNYSCGNLQLLCKRCHQIEHKCFLRLKGATTISKESTPQAMVAEAPDTLNGDDIV